MNKILAPVRAVAFLAATFGCGDGGDVVRIDDDSASQEITFDRDAVPETPVQETQTTPENKQFSETTKNTPNNAAPPTFDALLAAGLKVDAAGKTLDFSDVENLDGFDVAEKENRWKAIKAVRGKGSLTANSLRGFAKLPNLTEFLWTDATFSGDLSDVDDAFVSWKTLQNLKKVRLTAWKTAEGRFPQSSLKTLAQIPNLVDLDVSGSPATAEDWASVDLKTGFPKLTKLNLYRTNLGDAGVEALSPLADRLTSLKLDDAKIGPDSADKLVRFARLTFLHVGRSTLDDASVLKLAKLERLEKIHITRSNATEAGADALRAALPNCEVVSQPEPEK